MTVAIEILHARVGACGDCWLDADCLQRVEAGADVGGATAIIDLIVGAAIVFEVLVRRLFAENPRQAFAVEIQPLIKPAIHAIWQVVQTFCRNIADWLHHQCIRRWNLAETFERGNPLPNLKVRVHFLKKSTSTCRLPLLFPSA